MKRNFLYTNIVVISLVISVTVASICYAGSKITSQLKSTIEKVIATVTDEALKDDASARREILRKVIDSQFNYRQMVMRSLANNWDVRSNEEKQTFIALFKSLLENSYANKLESFSNEKINYLDEVVKGEYALVKTEVVRKATTIAVDYKLIRENGVWQVYDFVIEGVSMIRNYRVQFTKIIHKHSYEVLVQKLTDKINVLKGASESSEKL
jgi:phospholipid transport system substrate-binding protein